MSEGIDYSIGTKNVDLETGIHYGVIHFHEVFQAWADSSELEGELGEPEIFSFCKEGYVAVQPPDDPDIFIIKSPFYTKSVFCSPCAPGAVDLMGGFDEEYAKGYCFGHDWFEGGKAPYRVFRVEDDKEVFVD